MTYQQQCENPVWRAKYMTQQKTDSNTQLEADLEPITRIDVRGFKSINQEQSIDIRPLTLLAGANSSGKSSMMQPLLLLKQTLEAGYDPGPLLLDGPNLRFRSADEFLFCDRRQTNQLDVSLGLRDETAAELVFK